MDLKLLYLQEMVRNGKYHLLSNEEKDKIKEFYAEQIEKKIFLINKN